MRSNCESPGDPSADNPPGDRPPTRGWKLARQFAGWGLLALGAVGVALPVMPGWIFIAWGAVILAPDVPFIARLLDRLADKVPQLRSAIEWARGDRKEKHSE
jgi:hypothetical protein